MGVAEVIAHPNEAFQLRRIQFVPAQRPDVTPVPTGVDIIVLNGVLPQEQDSSMRPGPSSVSRDTKELFREQDVSLKWKTVQRPGAGLQNLGNTCFMNSVLQCLTHTPPLAEALLAGKQLGSNKSFDPLRLTQQQVINSLQNRHSNRSVAPTAHAKSLRQISKSFRLGRQEDAHEYLVALLDAMHESYISMCRPKPSPELSQTSMIYRIFAGRIRSQVKCTECGHESNTYDVFLDLSLEINKASSVHKALQRFTSSEYLDGANKYICPKQKQKVRAAKCMTIDQAPAVLVVQLKRFEFSMFGHKINKKVDFETELDLAPFMSNRRGPAQPYSLYGVLVHSGHSVHSGHYFAFVKAPNGLWHQLDDNHVSQVSERIVLSQKAYILFYIKSPTNGHAVPSELAQHAQQLSKGLNSLQAAAAVKGPSPATAPSAPHSKHSAPAPVFGPAQRPATALLAAKQLHDQLLASPAEAPHMVKADSTQQATTPAAETSSHVTSDPTASRHQLPTSESKGRAVSSGPSASHQQADADATADGNKQRLQPAKRKADMLGSGRRPSMMQKMNAAGVDAAADAKAGAEQAPKKKKKKLSTDQPTSAAAADNDRGQAGALSSGRAVSCDGLGSGTVHSGQAPVSAEHAAPDVGARGCQERGASQGTGGSCRGTTGLVMQSPEGPASPSSASTSGRHGASLHSPVRRPPRNALFPSPQNEWQGRSWNRLKLHNHIHRAHYARHVVASMLSQRSLSPPLSPAQQPPSAGSSPSRAATAAQATARAASGTPAEPPLPEQTHRRVLESGAAEPRHTGAEVAAAEVPHLKGQLLNGMRTHHPTPREHSSAPNSHPHTASGHPCIGSGHPQTGSGHPHTGSGLSSAAGLCHPASQMHSKADSGAAGPADNAAAAAALDGLPLAAAEPAADSGRLSVPAENGNSETEHQQQDVTAQMNGTTAQQAGVGSAKAFLSGIRPDPAPWDDVDPALAKERAALNRQQAPTKKQSLDEYDTEYDMGKQKKVKSKRGGQDAWQQGTNVFCKTARGRGRGSFRGRSSRGGGRGHRGGSGGRGPGRGSSGRRDRDKGPH